MNPDIKLVGVDIAGSLLLDTWKAGRVPDEVFLKTYKIEGIGEDFIPSTLDLSLIDEVVQVDDRESFQTARRLMREEAIFAGGSSGSAVAGLLKSQIVQALRPGQIAVVLLPDSGNRYLSKMFDDTWMRENGFLETSWPEKTIGELLKARPPRRLICVSPGDRLCDVASLMKAHDISQVPVVDGQGSLLGILSELELLDHLLRGQAGREHGDTIAALVNPQVVTAGPEESLGRALEAFEQGRVLIVIEGLKPTGILTKIDLIDAMAHQPA
jgi:cystathionine beta-synthase